MLNPFPIQFLALFAYLILRVAVGLLLITLGLRHLKERHGLKTVFEFRFFPYGLFFAWYAALVEIVLGALFILGFYTQIAALLTMLLSLKFIVMGNRFAHPAIPSRFFYALLFAASLSLFVTGAGAFAFDLPI